MAYFKKAAISILLTGIWINISETVRWLLLAEPFWVEQYSSMNLTFPTGPVNNLVWMIWGFLLAAIIFVFSKKFNLWQTALLSWFAVFAMMWVVMWNIAILPIGMLLCVLPLSLMETFIAAWICRRFSF